jgi:predicted benzoate:H+ symporter BenE
MKTRRGAGRPPSWPACSTCSWAWPGGAVVGLLAAFPKAMVLALAGLALLGSIGGGLASALESQSGVRAR